MEVEGVDMDTCDDSPPGAKKAKKSPPKKKKKGILGSNFPLQPPKNPVALLNELRQNLTFDLVSQTGPVHAPVFTMKVIVSSSSIQDVMSFFLPRAERGSYSMDCVSSSLK